MGEREQVAETRIEMVLARHRRTAVVAALRSAHPYEEPAFDLVELVALAGARGLGRVGTWAPGGTLADFAGQVAAALPATAAGVRVGGDPDRPVRTVAVCGGAGDDLFAEVRAAGADAYVTADLRHHPASEALEHGGPGAGRREPLGQRVALAGRLRAAAPGRARRAGGYGGDARLDSRDRSVDHSPRTPARSPR